MAKSVLSAAHFQDEEAAFAFVEGWLWPDGPTCPHCGATSEHVGRLDGVRSKPSKKNPQGKPYIGLRKCYACRKPFTVRMGTIFEDSHLPLHLWLQIIHLMCADKNGISTNEVQRILRCSMKTAWHLTHRIREIMAPNADPIGGEGKTVEMDETFIGGLEKNKHRNKRKHVGTGGAGKAAVFALVERGGLVRSHHVPNVTGKTLRPILFSHVAPKSNLMTDEGGPGKMLGREFGNHESINHSIGEYVRGSAHTNTVENFFSILKRGITGCYFHVSEAHLHRYLAEYDFRYSSRIGLGIDDVSRAERALTGAKGKWLTYRTTRGERTAEQSAP